ncbi:hypothetical protein TWF225_004221 [Orbilia oligospora]|uniref:Uncharacterized protein n=1 Tax=Orbilia oligospora TaxID=2813651 RepID=A0A8H2DTP8_ORBOL|nr:hypothetical protein TWF225_004221 [Orbilia oligospora]KAF3245158.1 hypothetical protein TWF128_009549 [Orbilia oligospora]KAF3272814.1 hypothetical protein TWF217_000275 [Orbilia oligospora]TGJ64783.1 hypothetical protein EYR41_010818 [Orbilia oligospora]
MLSWITFELVRKAIIRGEIELLELWKNFATEIDLRPMYSCKRYAPDVMHDAVRHKQITSVSWLFRTQHYTRSQVEEYKENALKCGDQDHRFFGNEMVRNREPRSSSLKHLEDTYARGRSIGRHR